MLRKEKVVVYALSSFLCNTLGRSGSLLFLKRGVESLELDACISGGEAPIDRDRLLIATVLPSLDFALQFPCDERGIGEPEPKAQSPPYSANSHAQACSGFPTSARCAGLPEGQKWSTRRMAYEC